ncbi:DUF664 domain-containing protein [Lentzea albidocapillata]|uniref:mycothiol transferase n=1 Tax=Lentzea albidocapillata TaxID=40571 RepID=UPI0030B82833
MRRTARQTGGLVTAEKCGASTSRALDAEVSFRGDRAISARWVLAHVIEETARHAGQLDVVRELLDGTAGD